MTMVCTIQLKWNNKVFVYEFEYQPWTNWIKEYSLCMKKSVFRRNLNTNYLKKIKYDLVWIGEVLSYFSNKFSEKLINFRRNRLEVLINWILPEFFFSKLIEIQLWNLISHVPIKNTFSFPPRTKFIFIWESLKTLLLKTKT